MARFSRLASHRRSLHCSRELPFHAETSREHGRRTGIQPRGGPVHRGAVRDHLHLHGGAEIRYTTDGSEPTATSGSVYSGPVQVSATTTIRAYASKTGWTDSPVASATFTIKTAAVTTATLRRHAVEPVTDAEIEAARNALARAREVDADYFDPDNYDAARQLLDEGVSLRTSDPDKARQKLSDSKDKADLAFTNSVEKSAQVMAANLEAPARGCSRWRPTSSSRMTTRRQPRASTSRPRCTRTRTTPAPVPARTRP